MKNEKIPCNEVATATDKNKFVLPHMTPDELDEFITFLNDSGYKIHEYGMAHDSFRKSVYNSYVSRKNATG